MRRRLFKFRIAVISVHALIFILGFILFMAPALSIASPEPGRTYGVWSLTIAIFEALVIASAFVHLRVRKVWQFLISSVGLIVLLYYIPHIVFYIEDLI